MASELAAGVGAALGIAALVGAGTAMLSGAAGPAAPAAATPGSVATVDREGSGIPQCDNYRTMPGDAFGYCLYKVAGGLPDVASVERVCGLAEEWEDECRHAWVAGKMNEDSAYDMDTLLGVCGENADCAFELLDFRPAELIDTQLERCRLHAREHADNCTGHAMQRWLLAGVDAEEVARVAAMPSAFPRKVGFWVAASVQCDGVGSCEGNPAVQAACEGQAEAFRRKPHACPAKTKAPLQPGSKPAGAVAGFSPGLAGGSGAPGGSVGGPATPGTAAGGPAVTGPATPGAPTPMGGPGTPPSGGATGPGSSGPTTPTPRVHHQPGTIPAGLPPRRR